jgi:aryl-alcohol dehydrogenase-like predicted oxidoreductase
LYRVVDAIDRVASETGKTVAQIALNWLLQETHGSERHHRRPQ